MTKSQNPLDLEVEIDLTVESAFSRGRKSRDLNPAYVRDLEDADLASLQRGTLPPPELKRLNERHHALAKLLAAGTPPGEAAIMLRYDVARVSILQSDPAFKELLALYSARADEEWSGQLELMGSVRDMALGEILDRLEDDEKREVISLTELRRLVTDMGDRTGLGPTSTQKLDVSVDMGARLEAARKRELEARRAAAQMIDVTPKVAE